eukprot:1166177-Alexandrium_andersonii.AAC.1
MLLENSPKSAAALVSFASVGVGTPSTGSLTLRLSLRLGVLFLLSSPSSVQSSSAMTGGTGGKAFCLAEPFLESSVRLMDQEGAIRSAFCQSTALQREINLQL